MNKWIFFSLSFVCILSSITKAYDMTSFVLETRWLTVSYLSGGLQKLSAAAAIATCVTEMTLALVVLKNDYRKIASAGFFLIFTFFLYLTGAKYFFPPEVGNIESCECFGELIHFTPMTSFIKSVVLWCLSLVLMVSSIKKHESWNITRLFMDKYLYLCLAVSLTLPLYSLLFLRELEHTVYIIWFTALCMILFAIVTIYLQRAYIK